MFSAKVILSGILASAISLSTFIFAEGEEPSLFSEFDFSTEGSSAGFIEASFEDLVELFDNSRTLSDTQKQELWNTYREKYVRWQGTIVYKGIGEQDWNRIGIRHNVGTNVEILLSEDKKKIVEMIGKMDVITYTGKLSRFFNRNLMFELVDANIEQVNGISTEELIERQQQNARRSSQEPAETESETKQPSEADSEQPPEKENDFTFADLDRVFGKNSSLSFAQKENLWNKYKGKRIRWDGIVTYKNTGETNMQRIGIRHTTGTNIELVLEQEKTEKEILDIIKQGETITYTGEIANLFGRNLLCSVVNVTIVKIGNKVFNENESTLSPDLLSELPPDPDLKREDEPEIIIAESMAPEVIMKDDLDISVTTEGFIKTTFEELEAIFGNESRITESQKDKLWNEYKGKHVRWEGRVINRGLGRVSGLRMGVSHSENVDVELCFHSDMKEKVLGTKSGDKVTYTGKLMNRRGYILPYLLEEGVIVEIRETQDTSDISPE